MNVTIMSEKGQVVIPKKLRTQLHLSKGSRFLVGESHGNLTLKKLEVGEDDAWMLASEETLKKTWDNPL